MSKDGWKKIKVKKIYDSLDRLNQYRRVHLGKKPITHKECLLYFRILGDVQCSRLLSQHIGKNQIT